MEIVRFGHICIRWYLKLSGNSTKKSGTQVYIVHEEISTVYSLKNIKIS